MADQQTPGEKEKSGKTRTKQGIFVEALVAAGVAGLVAWIISGGKKKPGEHAKDRKAFFDRFFDELGLSIQVPVPNVSDEEYAKQRNLGKELFYRPADAEFVLGTFLESASALKECMQLEASWGRIRPVEFLFSRAGGPILEPVLDGYWYWAEAMNECPRSGTSWNDLTKAVRLLSIDEYVVAIFATAYGEQRVFDMETATMLRTRWVDEKRSGIIAMFVDNEDGLMYEIVEDYELDTGFDEVGGRAVERV
ncbi:MAG: hypothetical protein ABIG71_00470 [Candidatus Uhrbacteria bacterium]